jgi:hypothetical protein
MSKKRKQRGKERESVVFPVADKTATLPSGYQADLQDHFPDMKGFSPRNLKYMRAFAQNWPDQIIVQEVLAQISWYHNLALLEKLNKKAERKWPRMWVDGQSLL